MTCTLPLNSCSSSPARCSSRHGGGEVTDLPPAAPQPHDSSEEEATPTNNDPATALPCCRRPVELAVHGLPAAGATRQQLRCAAVRPPGSICDARPSEHAPLRLPLELIHLLQLIRLRCAKRAKPSDYLSSARGTPCPDTQKRARAAASVDRRRRRARNSLGTPSASSCSRSRASTSAP